MAQSITTIVKLVANALYLDPNLNDWIVLAKTMIYVCFYGDSYNQAVALMAAHMWALSLRNEGSTGAAGSVNTIKEGDISISYSGGTSDEDLDQTHYGKQLKNLTKSSGAGITVLGAGPTIVCD